MHTSTGSELIDRPAEPGPALPQAPPIQVRNLAFVLLSPHLFYRNWGSSAAQPAP